MKANPISDQPYKYKIYGRTGALLGTVAHHFDPDDETGLYRSREGRESMALRYSRDSIIGNDHPSKAVEMRRVNRKKNPVSKTYSMGGHEIYKKEMPYGRPLWVAVWRGNVMHKGDTLKEVQEWARINARSALTNEEENFKAEMLRKGPMKIVSDETVKEAFAAHKRLAAKRATRKKNPATKVTRKANPAKVAKTPKAARVMRYMVVLVKRGSKSPYGYWTGSGWDTEKTKGKKFVTSAAAEAAALDLANLVAAKKLPYKVGLLSVPVTVKKSPKK